MIRKYSVDAIRDSRRCGLVSSLVTRENWFQSGNAEASRSMSLIRRRMPAVKGREWDWVVHYLYLSIYTHIIEVNADSDLSFMSKDFLLLWGTIYTQTKINRIGETRKLIRVGH